MGNYLNNYGLKIAIAYCLIASFSVVLISFIEGTFVTDNLVIVNGTEQVQHAYIKNISTILDFGFFNPIAIYFILKALAGFSFSYKKFGNKYDISPFNKLGILIVSVVIGVSTMWFYYKGFIGEVFFTSVFEPNDDGIAVVSITGWAVFFFTSIVLSLFTFFIFSLGNYIVFVKNLQISDIKFQLPPEISEDITLIIRPCINTLYAITTLFLVLCVFIFRDHYVNEHAILTHIGIQY